MNRFDRKVVTLDHAFHMHQAGTVGTGDVLGSCAHVVLHLISSHTDGHFGFLNRKHATEPTALVDTFRFEYLNAFHQREEIAQLRKIRDIPFTRRRKMQLAHTVTAIVNAYLVGKLSFQFLDLHNIV